MRILVISQRFYPEAFRINDICRELVKEGHLVTVLTGLPNYPSGHIPKEYRGNRRHKDSYDGAEVIRTWEVGRRPGKLGLAVNYASRPGLRPGKPFGWKKDLMLFLCTSHRPYFP